MRGSRILVLAAAALVLSGCSVPAPSSPTAAPTGSAAPAVSAPAVATFRVAGEEDYSIELATDDLVDHALAVMAGSEDGRIPVGTIVRDGDGGVNAPWSWHIDPASLEFADFTTEVCDGLPSFVEDRTLTSDIFCPWLTEVISVQPLR